MWLEILLFLTEYAKISKKKRTIFQYFIENYFKEREQLVCTFVLIDSRHDPQKIDLEFMKFLGENQIPFCIVFTSGFTSVLFVAALGIANALVWPAIWPLALTGLGKFTKTASALLIMAISGGAIIPPLYGALVDHKKEALIVAGINEANAIIEAASFGYWILLPCYMMILYYAFWGHKMGLKKV